MKLLIMQFSPTSDSSVSATEDNKTTANANAIYTVWYCSTSSHWVDEAENLVRNGPNEVNEVNLSQ
jgi:hypothetical protein